MCQGSLRDSASLRVLVRLTATLDASRNQLGRFRRVNRRGAIHAQAIGKIRYRAVINGKTAPPSSWDYSNWCCLESSSGATARLRVRVSPPEQSSSFVLVSGGRSSTSPSA